jgi:CRP/FNR family transcriptional regulator
VKELEELLKPIAIFQPLHEGDRKALAAAASYREYDSEKFVALAGDRWPYLCLVREGEINLVKVSPEGRSLGATRIEAGELFISPTAVDGRGLPASLRLTRPTSLYLWHREDILPILKRHPEAMWEVARWFVARMRQASRYVEELVFQPVASRLAHLLLEGTQAGETSYLRRDMTLEEIGTMIGTTGVMVCKLLHRFQEEGILEVTRAELRITDKGELRAIAGKDSSLG